jgi:hypothetical protein
MAIVAGSLGTIAVYWILTFAGLSLFTNGDALSIAVFLHGLILYMIFGWPIALVIAALVALPSYHYLASRGLVSWGRVCGAGTVAGLVFIPAGELLLVDHMRLDFASVIMGGISGGAGGGVFWAVIANSPKPQLRD